MKIPIKPFPVNLQVCNLGRHEWSVPRLIELSRGLEVIEIPLSGMNLCHIYKNLTLREMVAHFKAMEVADLDCPIILDEDGELLDGRHRIMKALWLGKETIKVVRFEENPSPCRVNDENAR